MKVLLINPPRFNGLSVIREDRCENIDRDCIHPPTSLVYLASILKYYGHSITLLDANAWNIGYDDIELCVTLEKPDWIVFRSTPSTFYHDIETVNIAKKYGVKTIMLNWNLSRVPDKVKRECPDLDYYVNAYHYEYLIPEIIGDVSGILDTPKTFDIPFPPWDLLCASIFSRFYTRTPMFSPWAVVRGSKGCGYRCSFCADQYQPWCQRTPELIADELEFLNKKRRVKRISFFDNTFEVGGDWCLEIADEIEKRNLNFKWYINSRADLIAKEGVDFFKRLHDVGLDGSSIGAEFGSQEMLDISNKDTTVEDNYECVDVLKKSGVKSYCSLMMGYLNETEEQMLETAKFVEESKPTGFQINPVFIVPGTMLHKQAKKYGKISPEIEDLDWRGLSCVPTEFPTVQLSELSFDELLELRKKIYKRLYLGGWFLNNVWNTLKSPSDWKIGFGYFLTMLGRLKNDIKFSH